MSVDRKREREKRVKANPQRKGGWAVNSSFPLFIFWEAQENQKTHFFLIFSCLSICLSWVLGAACGLQFSDEGWNPGLLHWEHTVLTTGPAEKSQKTTSVVHICQSASTQSKVEKGRGDLESNEAHPAQMKAQLFHEKHLQPLLQFEGISK